MNRWTSRQRKLVYMVAILVLLVPIVYLGMPATTDSTGGELAQLRQRYDLGETSLGDIDPASATMNLVLLGLRGVAANLLWMDLDHQKDTKNWAQMRATTESIIRLQPHFIAVWDFNGWNLAYNVSAEWDNVADRYYWVKEGGKFLMRGTGRNRQATLLYYDVGKVFGQKIGYADEARYYRRFFLQDPDEQRFKGGPDPEINDAGQDNYLVSKKWYQEACDLELQGFRPVGLMDRSLLHSTPSRSQLDYAQALHKEGSFGEIARAAWEEGYRDWTQKYGQVEMMTPGGKIHLEMTPDEAREATKTTAEAQELLRWLDQYQKMTNYRYWRTRALSESDPVTSEAHRAIYEAGREYQAQHLSEAEQLVLKGMGLFEQVMQKYPELSNEDATVEEAMTAVLLLQNIHRLNGEPLPASYPLKDVWDANQERVPIIEELFQRQFLPQGG